MVQELELFVEAGMTPYESVKAATVNAAEFAGEPGKSGIVAAGARADLVLLDVSPLKNVAAYRGAGLFANGRWLDREYPDRRMSEVEAQSERKARVFAADATWTVDEGEFVPLYAGFETFDGDRKTGTEPIARAYAGKATAALLAERRGVDGVIETFRAKTDDVGYITLMQGRLVNGVDTSNLESHEAKPEMKSTALEVRTAQSTTTLAW